MPSAAGAKTLNVSELISNNKISGFQLRILALCALVMLIDGLDTQSIGLVARIMSNEIGFQTSQIGIVTAAGLLGAAVGAFFSGQVGDRVGRKKALIGATIVFSAFTIMTAFATTYDGLILCRFLAGLGLGGAVPNVVSLNSEYAPKHIRAFMVTVQWSAFPLGGMIGAFLGSYIIDAYGWKSIFYIGGGVALAVALLLIFALPESVRYLLAGGGSASRIRAIVNKLAPGSANEATQFTTSDEKTNKASVIELFRDGRGITTLLIWVVFGISFMILVFLPLWVPTLLTRDAGITTAAAAILVALNNLGSWAGGLLVGKIIDRYGPYIVLSGALFLGTAFTAGVGYAAYMPFWGIVACDVLGGFLIGMGGNGCVALTAQTYPVTLRATGLGWAVTSARICQVGGSLMAGAMVAAGWKADQIFPTVALTALIAGIAVIGIKIQNPKMH